MTVLKRITALAILSVCLVLSFAFAPAGGYKIGDAVQPFNLKSVSGKMVSLADYNKERGLVIVFTCNHCPFAKLYQARINEFNKRYAGKGYPLVAISSNDAIAVPEDNFEEMIKRAAEEHYSFPYLYDSTQVIARSYNAIKTPHAFVLQHKGDKWIVAYSGAFDDNGAEPEKVEHHFVEEAIQDLEAGKPVHTPTTKSVGCGIKWRN